MTLARLPFYIDVEGHETEEDTSRPETDVLVCGSRDGVWRTPGPCVRVHQDGDLSTSSGRSGARGKDNVGNSATARDNVNTATAGDYVGNTTARNNVNNISNISINININHDFRGSSTANNNSFHSHIVRTTKPDSTSPRTIPGDAGPNTGPNTGPRSKVHDTTIHSQDGQDRDRPTAPKPTTDRAPVTTWDSDCYWFTAEDELLAKEIIDLVDDDPPAASPGKDPHGTTTAENPFARGPRRPARNGPLQAREVKLAEVPYQGFTLRPGSFVRCVSTELYDFLRITLLYKSGADGSVTVRGIPYIKIRRMNGILAWTEATKDELCALYFVDLDDARDAEVQAAIEIPLALVAKACELRTTNAEPPLTGPVLDTDTTTTTTTTTTHKHKPDLQVCRWKLVQYFPSARVRLQHAEQGSLYRGLEAALLRISPEEADPGFSIPRTKLREQWCSSHRLGGSYNVPSTRRTENTKDQHGHHRQQGHGQHDGHSHRQPTESQPTDKSSHTVQGRQKYTFFDAFCGAGGASRGAHTAQLRLKFAIDAWDRACETYHANFPQALLYHMRIEEWCRRCTGDFVCDVLHLSPPCQVFSPAHTIASAGQQDEANFASLFACEAVLCRVRPRIFTLEQTFGILHQHWRYAFNHLLLSFTRRGYSVRWKYVYLPEWGLPAIRKRLIMIGAAPGERLPPFPDATHGEIGSVARDPAKRSEQQATTTTTTTRGGWDRRIRPFRTVREALAPLQQHRRRDSLHMPDALRAKNLPSWDPDTILKSCVTTSGGTNYHYSGRRSFTPREFAMLQGFPYHHQFCGTSRIKQIGNAFPPCAAQVLFTHIRRWLEEEDSRELASQDHQPREAPRGGDASVPKSKVVKNISDRKVDGVHSTDPSTKERTGTKPWTMSNVKTTTFFLIDDPGEDRESSQPQQQTRNVDANLVVKTSVSKATPDYHTAGSTTAPSTTQHHTILIPDYPPQGQQPVIATTDPLLANANTDRLSTNVNTNHPRSRAAFKRQQETTKTQASWGLDTTQNPSTRDEDTDGSHACLVIDPDVVMAVEGELREKGFSILPTPHQHLYHYDQAKPRTALPRPTADPKPVPGPEAISPRDVIRAPVRRLRCYSLPLLRTRSHLPHRQHQHQHHERPPLSFPRPPFRPVPFHRKQCSRQPSISRVSRASRERSLIPASPTSWEAVHRERHPDGNRERHRNLSTRMRRRSSGSGGIHSGNKRSGIRTCSTIHSSRRRNRNNSSSSSQTASSHTPSALPSAGPWIMIID